MRYIFIVLTLGLMAAGSFANEPTNNSGDKATLDQIANTDNNDINLEDGNSSNWGWWNLGYRYGYGYPYYGYGCGASYPSFYSSCGGYNYYSWGFYNPNYLYRIAPMVR